ncbi:MAG: hypothetical protein WHS64_08050 [Fervidobacterium sp.]|uniref:hypothetical protein n=1 Tax=Fervidobacterium sp. TaxID=1871331 RepID=UPI000934A4BD|nr:hypothetical protein [Fervidobacterium gondwanense]
MKCVKKFLVSVFLILHLVSFSAITFNNTHLERLGQKFLLEGEEVKGYWVYANNKGDHFEVATAQGEGDTCADDVARVVLLYSEAYEITKDVSYLELAKEASKFVLKMQTSDGEFYNFAWVDGTINKHGITSEKSSSWWALRAFAGLSKLAQFHNEERIMLALRRAYSAIKRKPPIAGDQLSLYVIGLSNYYKLTKDENVKKDLEKYSMELTRYEWTGFSYLKGFFSVYQDRFLWNGWGNHYTEALVEAYKVLGDSKLIELAKRSLDNQIPLLLSTGLIYSIGNYVKLYPELAYALECVVVPNVKLFEITGDEKYAYFASLLSSWLFGGNRLGVRMLGESGEGYDGLEYMHYNRNAGAESTICALRSLLYVMKLPEKFQILAENPNILGREGLKVLEAETFDVGISDVRIVTGDYGGGAALKINERARLKKVLDNIKPGKYYVLISGVFSNNAITISAVNQLKKNISGSGIFEVGEIQIENSLSLSLTNSCSLDQVVLIPEYIGISFKDNETSKSLVYNLAEKKTQITEAVVFEKIEKRVSYEVEVDFSQINEFKALDLKEIFNNDGFGTPQRPGNFDNLGGAIGAYLPESEVNEGITVIKDIPFYIATSGLDNIRCDGQVIKVNGLGNYSTIYILAAANHGDYKTELNMNGQRYEMQVKDWCNEPEGLVLDYRYIASGEKQFIRCGLDLYSVSVQGLDFLEITLPMEMNVHIFAITVK